LQADVESFVNLTSVVSDEVAPPVEVHTTLSAFAEHVGRATTGGAAMVVVVGVDVDVVVVVGRALDPPHAVKLAPISTNIPMTRRCVTPSLVLLD
jgi:hypothetical protein